MNYELLMVDFTSEFYPGVVQLRNEVLRKPLGLTINENDTEDDKNQYIAIAVDHNEVLGCMMVKIIKDNMVKFRQMAIKSEAQKNGIGSALLYFAENFCLMNGYGSVELHARLEAIPFYIKNNYLENSHEFMEVGIIHKKMIKNLEPVIL